jgi:hypothetical protein
MLVNQTRKGSPFDCLFKNFKNNSEFFYQIREVVEAPKILSVEMLIDAEAFYVMFPIDATNVQKAIITGSAFVIGPNFFLEVANNDSGSGILESYLCSMGYKSNLSDNMSVFNLRVRYPL